MELKKALTYEQQVERLDVFIDTLQSLRQLGGISADLNGNALILRDMRITFLSKNILNCLQTLAIIKKVWYNRAKGV